MTPDAAAPFRGATVIKGRIEPHVFDELLGVGKALDVPDESAQSEGDDFPDAAPSDDGKQIRFGQHLLSDEAHEYPVSLP